MRNWTLGKTTPVKPMVIRRAIQNVPGFQSPRKEQLLEFERGRIIGLKEAGWKNQRIARYMGRRVAAIERCWQEWVDSGRFQRPDGSGRPRATANWDDRLSDQRS
ncbi:HTH_Tnp_Tc3_2 domain-containing protein [Trichonephila clavipes]|nr:HTH_Tnp_Tc3_2 domain-containing protein [Trichonephila clavipes]